MAQDCEFDMFQQKALLIQFICGILGEKIRGRLLNGSDLKSFEKATLITSSVEITDKQPEVMKQSDYLVNTIITKNKNCYKHTSRTAEIAARKKHHITYSIYLDNHECLWKTTRICHRNSWQLNLSLIKKLSLAIGPIFC